MPAPCVDPRLGGGRGLARCGEAGYPQRLKYPMGRTDIVVARGT